jgi:integrase
MATFTKRGDFWQAKIRRIGYPPISETFEKKTDAEAWARALESELDKGVWRDRSTAEATTFYALLDLYLRDVVPTKRGADIISLRIKAWQRDRLALHKLTALTPPVLAAWRDSRLAAGCAGGTVNRELSEISSILNWGRKELMLQFDNPISAIRRPKNAPGRDRMLEEGEEDRLLAALGDHSGADEREDGKQYRRGSRNAWIKPVVQFALATAMRRGEILSMVWSNVDLKKRIAFLPMTKNGEPRTVPLSSVAIAVLNGLPRSIDGMVFPVSPNAVKLAFVRACKIAGLENFHFHDLRHEATSRMAGKLPNVVELSAVTGHKTLQMLKRYYHPRAEDLALKLG